MCVCVSIVDVEEKKNQLPEKEPVLKLLPQSCCRAPACVLDCGTDVVAATSGHMAAALLLRDKSGEIDTQ